MQKVIDNTLLNYEVLGNGKKNILILHGWGRSMDDWREVAKKISIDKKVILLDLPGFGNSSSFDEIVGTYDYAKVVSDFINDMKLKNLILIGHSFGGKVGVVVASENKNVRKLILVDASGVETKSIITDFKITFAKIINFFPLNERLKNKVKNMVSSEDYKNAGELRESFKKIVSEKVDKEAKNITANTLMIWGDKDKEVNVENGKKFRSLIKNSTLRIVWGAFHHPHLEKQEKFLEILEEFIC